MATFKFGTLTIIEFLHQELEKTENWNHDDFDKVLIKIFEVQTEVQKRPVPKIKLADHRL
jgi:TolB-like protein